MRKDEFERPAKTCKRCNKYQTTSVICNQCKNELTHQYDDEIGWETAYQIEQELKAVRKFRI